MQKNLRVAGYVKLEKLWERRRAQVLLFKKNEKTFQKE